MRFANPLAYVSDIDRATRFYEDVMGLRVAEAHPTFVRFETGFAIHDAEALHADIFGAAPMQDRPGHPRTIFYFETRDLDGAFTRLSAATDILHPIRIQAWGGRLFRATDPDGHILEIGAPFP
ncbi:VOC family protein [Hasllibacter sp. MH4015]|uniref:VOC family protein n=1 Tax=Hasllibacter sp. MH4015 TaxID=2854029 RepID=UPI001CD3F57C|nr:VOC family protein [Hasllibacter sp. MH4015]